MKLLALKTEGTVRPFIHGAMVRAFRALGEEVVDRPVPRDEKDLMILDREIRDYGIRAVFTLDLGASPFWVSRFREIQSRWRIPFLVWFVDDPEGYAFPEAADPRWTLAFCWDRQLAGKWSPSQGISLEHLPLATDPDLFRPAPATGTLGGVFVGALAHPNALLEEVIQADPDIPRTAWRIWRRHRTDFRSSLRDLVLGYGLSQLTEASDDPLWRLWLYACLHEAGRMKRRMMVEEILGERGLVYGPSHWKKVLRRTPYGGTVTYGDDLCRIYRRSIFVLETRQPQAPSGLTQRIFDASACATAVLAEWSEELELFYEPGKECLAFRNIEEGMEVAHFLRKYPQRARSMALEARRRTLARHTYRHRAEDLRRRLMSAL